MKVVLTPRASSAIEKILTWTRSEWGPQQAISYRRILGQAIADLAMGKGVSQSCRSAFAEELRADLRFIRAGRHFVVFVQKPNQLEILDILHQSADLTARLTALD
jgi:toxin ParE1/3/4